MSCRPFWCCVVATGRLAGEARLLAASVSIFAVSWSNCFRSLPGDWQLQRQKSSFATQRIPILLAEVRRLRGQLDWFRGQEVSVAGFAAPCQCEEDYFQGCECPRGFIPENDCPYYNFRGTGACWVGYVEHTVTGKGETA